MRDHDLQREYEPPEGHVAQGDEILSNVQVLVQAQGAETEQQIDEPAVTAHDAPLEIRLGTPQRTGSLDGNPPGQSQRRRNEFLGLGASVGLLAGFLLLFAMAHTSRKRWLEQG